MGTTIKKEGLATRRLRELLDLLHHASETEAVAQLSSRADAMRGNEQAFLLGYLQSAAASALSEWEAGR